MKKNLKSTTQFTVFIITAICLMFLCSCAGWTYNGIRGDDIAKASWSERGQAVGGFAAAFIVHTAGHIAYLEAIDEDWHFDGLEEIVDGRLKNSERQWFGRAGFVAALGTGWIARVLGADGFFWRGYYMGVAAETLTYPIRWGFTGDGDLGEIYKGNGNAELEWAVYSAASIGLLIK